MTRATRLERNYLESGDREGINVAPPRRVAPVGARTPPIEQFRSHVTDNSWLISHRDGGSGKDCCDSIVSEAHVTIFSDQDVPLDRSRVGTCPPLANSISYREDVTVHDSVEMQIFETTGTLRKLSVAQHYTVCL